MNSGIKDAHQTVVTTCLIFDTIPHTDWHEGVMTNMEEGNVVVFLMHNEEYRVYEVDELGEIVPVGSMHHPDGFWFVREITSFTAEIV